MNEIVSIIIPIYNSELYLKRCIESVINQTYQMLEIILINDGSTDKSDEICRKYESKDKRIIYRKKINSGVSDTRNYGINISNGKYLFFLDSDDWIDNEVIYNLMKNKIKNSLIGVKIKNIYDSKEIIEKRKNKYLASDFFCLILKNKINGYSTSYLYDSKMCKKIKFNTEISYCEDILFLFEYINCNKIEVINFIDKDSYYNYYHNPNSVTLSSNNLIKKVNSLNNSMKILKKEMEDKYNEIIDNKNITLIEAELQKCKNSKELNYIINEIELPKYNGNNLRYKIFYYLYNMKQYNALKLYYIIRKVMKKVKYKFR